MKAPKRWIETQSGSTALERALLSPGLNVEVPAGVEDRIWASLTAAAPVVATGALAAHAAQGAASKVPLSVIAKAFAIGAASGALLTGGLSALEPARIAVHAAPAPSSAPPSSVRAKRPAGSPVPSSAASVVVEAVPPPAEHSPAAPARERTRAPEQVPRWSAVASEPVSVAPPPVAPPGSRLKEEAATLRQARAALRRGDLPGASAALEVARSQFGNGALGEEREALTIELLVRSGQHAAADARAAAFLRSFPNSPHAAHVRSFASEPQ